MEGQGEGRQRRGRKHTTMPAAPDTSWVLAGRQQLYTKNPMHNTPHFLH